jgi:hypothetical protein
MVYLRKFILYSWCIPAPAMQALQEVGDGEQVRFFMFIV